MSTSEPPDEYGRTRYEYRVWGKHRKARKRLAELATAETQERIEDCYLLIGDANWNAKIRDNTLKLKQLITEHKGFERWASAKHRKAKTAPSPFDMLFEELDLAQAGDKRYDLAEAVAALDPALGVRAVFVVKDRIRYRIGELRAEATKVRIEGTNQALHTLVIEGDDLDALRQLRKTLGLRDEPNTPVHAAIDVPED